MLKVLYLLNHAGKAGTERYVYALIESLHQKKIQATFVYNENGLLVDRLKALGIETFQINMRNPYDLKAAKELGKLCKKLDIDLIHTHYLRENYIALLSRMFNKKTKVIYTNHFILKNNGLLKLSNKILTHFEARVISVCNKGKEMMASNWISRKKIEVIHNGVDPQIWGEKEPSTIRQELNIPEDMFTFLCVSRFAHDKGHRYLVNAVAELKKMTDRKFKCILANDGPLLEEIKQQVAEMKLQEEVIFVGFRKDVKNLVDGSNLYINSSEHEALSFAIVEVLAAGLPVIATDMGGNDDIINARTDCGLLVEYNNPKALAEAVLKVMKDKDLQKRLSINAVKAVKEIFNVEIMVDKTYNVYIESCGNKS